ncbi:MAG: circadian clock protein KaiC [Anaerolineae bacterium]
MSQQQKEAPIKELSKMATGVEGLDEITRGGLLRWGTTLVVGGPGSGKTVLALQTLVNGARLWGEPGIFVAFEERSGQILANAAAFGWDLVDLRERDLFFLDARASADVLVAGEFDLRGLLASLRAKAQEMGARRIVFDSIDVLLTLLDDPLAERRELYRIHDWLGEGEMGGIITSRSYEGSPAGAVRQEFLQFMSDCVVSLSHRVVDLVSLRGLRIVKYRGSGFSENEAPLIIGPSGMQVAAFAQESPLAQVSDERVTMGVQGLDEMLAGGPYRGTSTLITGSPGTAKSNLSGAFVEAACRRGEGALYVSFDEPTSQIVRNLASVGIQLQPHLESGLLHMHWGRALAQSAEAHLLDLKARLDELQPTCLAIDPLSALIKSGGQLTALGVAQRLLLLAKERGITLVCTSLLHESGPTTESSALQVSTIADNWIHLSYVAQNGERNRALSIIKARGIHHSNQVRELILSDEGLHLTDVYAAGGEVLMGTLRWEREQALQAERDRLRVEMEHRRHELQLAEAEIQARIQAMERELEARRADLEMLSRSEVLQESVWRDSDREVVRRRMEGASAENDAPDRVDQAPEP